MIKPIKVLVVVCQMNRGGLECRMMDILRFIDRAEISIDFFTYRESKGYFDDEIESLGSKIFYNKPLNVRNMISYSGYFADFLKNHPEYKIVHAHQNAWCSVFCKGAQKAGVPVRIAHSRTSLDSLSLGNLVKNIIKLSTPKYATHYFAVSDRAGRWLFGNRNFNKGKVQIWPNAIDTHPFRYSEEKYKHMRELFNVSDKQVVMHVGNFTPAKNHIFLVELFYEYHKMNNKSILVLAGKGEREYVENKIQELGIKDNVMFLGGRDDIQDVLQAADVFVFPSLFEGFPGAVLEAQAAGLPCVISDKITKEVCILDNVRQIPLEISEWCEAIDKALKEPRKDAISQIEASGYDIRTLVVKLSDFYRNVAKDL